MKKIINGIAISVGSAILLSVIFYINGNFKKIEPTYNSTKSNYRKIMLVDSLHIQKNKVQNELIIQNRAKLNRSFEIDSIILCKLDDIQKNMNIMATKQNILLKNNKKSAEQWEEIKGLIPTYSQN